MSRFDVEALAVGSSFGSLDGLALYVARNVGVPRRKLCAATGLSEVQVGFLLTSRVFRERLSEMIAFVELSPAKERVIFQRMLEKATDAGAEFRDVREAATWVFRQSGVLRAEKAQVEHGGSVRVSFALDSSTEDESAYASGYVAPDPFAGVVGLRGGLSSGEELGGFVGEDVVDAVAFSVGEGV